MAVARSWQTAVGTALAGAYAWWVTGLEPFSTSATVAVVAGGVAALVWGRRRPSSTPTPEPGSSNSRRGIALWTAVVTAAAGWQLAAWFQSPREEHPTLSYLANAALDPRPLRVLAVVGWLAVAATLAR